MSIIGNPEMNLKHGWFKAKIDNEKIIDIEIDEVIDNRYIDHVISCYSCTDPKKNFAEISVLFDIETGKYGYWWTTRNLNSYNPSFKKPVIEFEVRGGIIALNHKSLLDGCRAETFKDYVNYIVPWIEENYNEYKKFMFQYIVDSVL